MRHCGFPLPNGKSCKRKVKFGFCYMHTGKQPKLKEMPITISDQDLINPNKLETQYIRQTTHSSRPEPPPGYPKVVDHLNHLAWLTSTTRRHTAGNTQGLNTFQCMQNYHGMLALKRLTEPDVLPYGVRVVFAGGTCLALGHRITARYSEDIDALLINGSQLSSTQRLEVLKAAREQILDAPNLVSTDSWITNNFIKQEFEYPMTFEDEGKAGKRLYTHVDLGFSDDFPSQDLITVTAETFMSLRGDRHYAARFSDLQPFNTLAVRPNVTLVEKMIALHQRAAFGSKKGLVSRARDVFDIGYLVEHQPTLAYLQEPGSTALDIDDRLKQREEKLVARGLSRKHRLVRRPPGGFADSPIWDLKHPMSKALQKSYQSLGSALIYDKTKKLKFAEVADRVQSVRHLL